MNQRPDLSTRLSADTFRNYYYLKEELADFCREQGLSASGGKLELTERIAVYLETGITTAAVSKKRTTPVIDQITDDRIIEENFVCSEKHRAYFKERKGNSFSFNVLFQKWLKANAGKTYAQALEAYDQILKDKKQNQTTIDKQFEYNTYIRDFFADNKDKKLDDAIRCWKYKKSMAGHNRYEKEDLVTLL
ncbi:MAG: hypothetical protein GX567_05265 [Clostridia bacterium]|nr:hypothetical protein [Clostridia bacterium]